MALIFDLREWERSERAKLITDVKEYIEDVKKHALKALNNQQELEKLIRSIGEEVLDALQRISFSRIVLGNEASGYIPVSPDLIVCAVILLMNLYAMKANDGDEIGE